MFRCAFLPLSEAGRVFKTKLSRSSLSQMVWTQAKSCSTLTRMGSEYLAGWAMIRCQIQNQTLVHFAALENASWPFLCFSFLTSKPGCEAHLAGRGSKVPCSETQKHPAGCYPPLQSRETIVPTGWGSQEMKHRGICPDPKWIQDKTKPSQAPTLAELTAGLPWAMLIPVKLLRFVLNGDIECVTNVRIVQIAHW